MIKQIILNKVTYLVLTIFFSYSSLFAQRNELESLKINGKVKFYTECSYKAVENSGKIEKGIKKKIQGPITDVLRKFNEDGDLIEELKYISGSLERKIFYKYDNKGNLIEKNLRKKYIYKYDNDGNLTEEYVYDVESLIEKRINSFDSKGNRTESIFFTYDGSKVSETISKYDYDSKRNWVKKIVIRNGIAQYIEEREYE